MNDILLITVTNKHNIVTFTLRYPVCSKKEKHPEEKNIYGRPFLIFLINL